MPKLHSNIKHLLILALFTYGCQEKEKEMKNSDLQGDSAKASAFFETSYTEYLNRHPIQQSVLGIRDRYSDWDDLSDSAEKAEVEISKQLLGRLKTEVDFEKLDPRSKVSYQLFVYEVEQKVAGEKYLLYNYPVNQLFGYHSEIPSFLINVHTVTSKSDAEAYISRLEKIPFLFDQLIEKMKAREKLGIIPPRFVFPLVTEDCKGLLKGQPFEKSKERSSLFEDITSKVNTLKISQEEKKTLLARAEKALLEKVKPAYEALLTYWKNLEKKATTDDGCWKFPDGDGFYKQALKATTTTSLSPNEVFETGQKEVARIHQEMQGIMDKVGYKGTLKSFFQHLQASPEFYYPSDSAGKKAYVTEAKKVIEDMKARLDELFKTKPKADLIVKQVESFREKSSAGAFYQEPAPDGSRPGIYYVNTYDMKTQPKFEIEALAYHEAIPGHHMQLAIAQEMTDLPKFRKYGFYTAYIEGWALYTELVPKEMGLYQDPYRDFGRLSMELLRAARLVVDVGIHSKKWTREQAIKYFTDNTPNSEYDCRKEIERYIVWPSQATAYKIGMLKILALRENAKKKLGDKFDIREFHDVVLTNGAVPLDILEQLVKEQLRIDD
jgi:uncharacterized protein (DUF885 family)